jgi:hypothetical protein
VIKISGAHELEAMDRERLLISSTKTPMTATGCQIRTPSSRSNSRRVDSKTGHLWDKINTSFRQYAKELCEMKKMLCSCLAFGALGGAALMHPTLAMALEPVWLTEEEMDGITAGFTWSGPIVGSWTQTFTTTVGDQTALTSATIVCASCNASVSVDSTIGISIVINPPFEGSSITVSTVVH